MSISNAIPSKNIWITSTIVQGNSLKFEGSLKSLSVAFGIKLAGTWTLHGMNESSQNRLDLIFGYIKKEFSLNYLALTNKTQSYLT